MQSFGVIGLGVMGQNLAMNITEKGFSVAGFDLDPAKAKDLRAKWPGANLTTAGSIRELVESLETPRRILLMVPAGKPVDTALHGLKPFLSPGDIVIDGGNSFFQDTNRRAGEMDAAGFHLIGAGISGGEEGARHGPSIMPGGAEEAYLSVEPVLTAIAAKTKDGPCTGYIGPGGAGHYVKMVHNGIEYGVMQLIAEAYDLMRSALGMTAPEIRDVFARWNESELNSYLIEITALVLGKSDPETGRPLVDLVLDWAGQKGTGRWTAQNAFEIGVAIPVINAALEARVLSALKEERVAASVVLHGPDRKFGGDRQAFLDKLFHGLRLAIVACYAQGFALMREASREYGYSLRLPEIARIWKGGCIIRARLLDIIQSALADTPEAPNLLVQKRFSPLVNELSGHLRDVVSEAARLGVPCLALAASLGYIDCYRSARLSSNLIQAQRDYFGAHRYERIDKPRGQTFHTEWRD